MIQQAYDVFDHNGGSEISELFKLDEGSIFNSVFRWWTKTGVPRSGNEWQYIRKCT